MKKNEGITLIALVITIIVLLILAGVTLNLISGGDGILSKAETSVDKTNEESIIELVALEVTNKKAEYYQTYPRVAKTFEKFLDGQGYQMADGSEIEFSVLGEIVEITYTPQGSTNTVILAMDSKQNIDIVEMNGVQKPDTIAPIVEIVSSTTQSIKYKVKDNRGIAAIAITQTDTEPADSEWETISEVANNEFEKTGLVNGEIYYIWAKDTTGNIGKIKAETKNFEVVTPDVSWSGTEGTVEITSMSGVTIQYKIGENGTWMTYNEAFTAQAGQVVYFQATDGKNTADLGSVTLKMPVTVSYDANGGTGNVPAQKEYEEGNEVTVDFSKLPTKQGYNFIGWATTADAETAEYTETATFSIGSEDVTFYAVWEIKGISKKNYGEYVDLETNLIIDDNIALEDGTYPETDWRIFYRDDQGGIYLILADYLPYKYEKSETAGSSTGLGTGLINSGSSYPYNWRSSAQTKKDMLERLLDSSTWNKLLEISYIEDKRITVTGGVDLLTWVASWNTSGYTRLYTAQDSVGDYYIGTRENPTSYTYSASLDETGYRDTLYFPHQNSTSRTQMHAYWLASPGYSFGSGHNRVMNVGYTGDVTSQECGTNSGWRGVRPAVYIPAGVELEKNAQGIWRVKK